MQFFCKNCSKTLNYFPSHVSTFQSASDKAKQRLDKKLILNRVVTAKSLRIKGMSNHFIKCDVNLIVTILQYFQLIL